MWTLTLISARYAADMGSNVQVVHAIHADAWTEWVHRLTCCDGLLLGTPNRMDWARLPLTIGAALAPCHTGNGPGPHLVDSQAWRPRSWASPDAGAVPTASLMLPRVGRLVREGEWPRGRASWTAPWPMETRASLGAKLGGRWGERGRSQRWGRAYFDGAGEVWPRRAGARKGPPTRSWRPFSSHWRRWMVIAT